MQQRLDVKPHSSLGSESQARVSTHDVSLQVVIRTNCNQTLPVLAGWLSLFGHSDSKNTRMNSGGFGLIHAAIPSRRWEQIGFVP